MSGKHDFDDNQLELQLMDVTEDPTYAQTTHKANTPVVLDASIFNGDTDTKKEQWQAPILH